MLVLFAASSEPAFSPADGFKKLARLLKADFDVERCAAVDCRARRIVSASGSATHDRSHVARSLDDEITDANLAGAGVLVIAAPAQPLSPNEVRCCLSACVKAPSLV